MIGDLNFKEVEEVLKDQLIGRIGCHSNGVTYIVPVSYAYN
jgi:nitroimidazol reductase NimA-like FMN-containing flavoprotein (pyridoxamine 5'-phosphate oxidase superfamily)